MLALTACQQAKDAGTAVAVAPVASAKAVPELATVDPDMRGVLLTLQALDPKPLGTVPPVEARLQPTPADAVKRVLQEQAKSTAPEPVKLVRNLAIKGQAGSIPARIYVPTGAAQGSPLPVIVYYHGGGWVIADIDTYDASERAIANQAGAIVVAINYRQAPEHKFPAAHEDAFAAYQWTLENARSIGGDPKRVAVVGESAGGNLAVAVSMLARSHGLPLPVHEVAIYPIAGTDLNTLPYIENAAAMPLDKPAMAWFFDNYLRGPADMKNSLIDLVNAPDLAGLPPTTIVTDQVDPLRSEGQTLAQKLQAAGVPVASKYYPGVTHEFFGMGAVVAKAKEAEAFVGSQLRNVFAHDPLSPSSKPNGVATP